VTSTRETAEAFLLETLTENGIPTSKLHTLAAEHGLTPEDLKQHRTRLFTTTSSQAGGEHTSLHRRPCIVCGERTPYTEADHGAPCCADCPSPITTWRWTQPAKPGSRSREKVKVAHRSGGWPSTEWGHPGERTKVCSSVFDRKAQGLPLCADPVVWKVQCVRGRSVYSSYYCDAELPCEYRPAEPAPAPAGVGDGEQHALF
jgi:hypothetical protein